MFCSYLIASTRVICFFFSNFKLPGQDVADLDDNSEDESEDGIDADLGKPDKNTSDSRMGGQPILEAQPEINMKVPSNHFDFGAILPLLSNLEEIYVCYKVVSI